MHCKMYLPIVYQFPAELPGMLNFEPSSTTTKMLSEIINYGKLKGSLPVSQYCVRSGIIKG